MAAIITNGLTGECPKFRQRIRIVAGVISSRATVSGTIEAMNLLRDLDLRAGPDELINMVVESPKGSGLKLKYCENQEVFLWSRPLVAGVTFPYDFGFLPQTEAPDGDAIDAMLLTDLPSYPGVVVPCRVIGALRVEQCRDGQMPKRNDRIMVLPEHEHRLGSISEVGELAERVRDEIEAFFTASLLLTGKQIKFCGWADATEARALVDTAADIFAAMG